MTYFRICAARRATRSCLVVTALAVVAGRISAQTPSAVASESRSIQLNSENVRFNNYLHELAGRGAFLSVIGGGVLDQIRNTKNGPDDLSGRMGTRAIQRAVDVSVHHGLAAIMHRAPSASPPSSTSAES